MSVRNSWREMRRRSRPRFYHPLLWVLEDRITPRFNRTPQFRRRELSR